MIPHFIRQFAKRHNGLGQPRHWQPSFEILEDRTVPVLLVVVSESGTGTWNCTSTTVGHWPEGDTTTTSSDQDSWDFFAATGRIAGSAGGTQAGVYLIPGLPIQISASAVSYGGVDPYPIGDFSWHNVASASANATRTWEIVPEGSEQVGDVVRMDVEVTDSSSGGGTFGYSISGVATGPGSYQARIGDRITITLQANANVNTIDNVEEVGSSGQGSVMVYLEKPHLDINVLDATATASSRFRNLRVKYAVEDDDLPQGFVLRAYQSADAYYDEGVDQPLLGQWTINGADAKAGRIYTKTFTLGAVPAVTLDQRFIIVVADPDNTITESSEANNEMFVIPLFKRGQFGGFTDTGTFVVGLDQYSAVSRISGRISRGTSDYDLLDKTSVQPLWETNGRTFPLLDKAPYSGDDWTVQPSLLEPLHNLVTLVNMATDVNRLTTSFLSITDAFDEEGGHSKRSLHYEGRAIDFDAQPQANERLTGLTMLSGFRWVWHEPDASNSHVHVSHIGFNAEVSFAALSTALEWGSQNGLVPNTAFKTTLSGLLQQGTKQALQSFRTKLQDAPPNKIKPKLRNLLLLNADALFATL